MKNIIKTLAMTLVIGMLLSGCAKQEASDYTVSNTSSRSTSSDS